MDLAFFAFFLALLKKEEEVGPSSLGVLKWELVLETIALCKTTLSCSDQLRSSACEILPPNRLSEFRGAEQSVPLAADDNCLDVARAVSLRNCIMSAARDTEPAIAYFAAMAFARSRVFADIMSRRTLVRVYSLQR